MAQFVVRNVDNEVKKRLQRRATQRGHSMEQEVREILREATREDGDSEGGLGTEISSLFREAGLDTGIAELRGSRIKAVSFRR